MTLFSLGEVRGRRSCLSKVGGFLASRLRVSRNPRRRGQQAHPHSLSLSLSLCLHGWMDGKESQERERERERRKEGKRRQWRSIGSAQLSQVTMVSALCWLLCSALLLFHLCLSRRSRPFFGFGRHCGGRLREEDGALAWPPSLPL